MLDLQRKKEATSRGRQKRTWEQESDGRVQANEQLLSGAPGNIFIGRKRFLQEQKKTD